MKTNTTPSTYKGYRFPPEIISHAVWLYFRFSLSFREYHLNISGQDKPTIWWKPCCADRDGYDGQRVERISFHLTARQEAVN